MARNLVFYVKEWLEREDFELFLKFSRYLGREDGMSKFVIDLNRLEKAVKNKEIEPSEIVDMFANYEIEFENGSIDDIKKLVESLMPRVTIKIVGREVVLVPHTFLGEKVKDLMEKRWIRYDHGQKVFRLTKPMFLFDTIEALKSRGISVQNDTGINEKNELPIKITFKGELRDYQVEALEAWRRNGYKGVVALPTGAGKTIIAIAAIAELNVRTLIVSYTKEQMFQWGDKIASFTDVPRTLIGYFYGSEKRLAPITIITYQSAYRYIDTLSPYFSLLIVDEVHHLPADKFRFIAENMFARYRLGLSATVIREDGRHIELFPLMGGVVYSKSLYELAERGYIAQFSVKTVKVGLTPDEKKRYKELSEKYRELARGRSFEEILEEAKRGNPKALEAVKVRSEMRMLVHNAQEKLKAIEDIVARELEQGSKILIFTQYVDQAKQIAERLGTYYIVGELDETTRRRRLEAFKQGLVRVLVLTTVGDEGIDVPDANVGIVVAGTSSRRQFIQRLGRLLRPAPGKQAKLYEIVVKGTFEEAESRKRKEALKMLFQDLIVEQGSDIEKL
uniref:DNA 3'-5' helicase n=1 Tax=Ignisphaera aggregans TaxID=334771 RepID=A0A7C2VAT8_9CREN